MQMQRVIHQFLNAGRIGEQPRQFPTIHRFVEQQCGNMRHSLEVVLAVATEHAPDRQVVVAPGPVEQRDIQSGKRRPVGETVARPDRRTRHRLAQPQPVERVLPDQFLRHPRAALQYLVGAVGFAECACSVAGYELDDDPFRRAAHVHRADIKLAHRHRNTVQYDACDGRAPGRRLGCSSPVDTACLAQNKAAILV